ncbi:MAG: hypothetical protein V1827_02380 [Candidatus Micrarchaeota archaeon]
MRLSIVILLFILALSSAEDYVVINSMDGRDVLSGVYYANVLDLPVKYMPNPGGDPDLFVAKVGSGHEILLVQGSLPVSGLVESGLKAKNNDIEVYASADGLTTNLALAKKSGADRFIVVDSAYADGAISVLPYAALTHSYVLLADKNNAGLVKGAVSGKTVIIYGYVDEEVKIALAAMDPEIIGKGEDKFEDNLLIAEKTMDEFSLDRVIISDGSFIEDSISSGGIPLILTGRIVPSPTYSFIKLHTKDGTLNEVLLLGNQLVDPIYDMRENIEAELLDEGVNETFLITVKFAQIIPGLTGTTSLDTFSLPAYKPSLNISEVAYNQESKKLMLSVENLGEGAAYYTMEAHVKVDGEDLFVLTASEPVLIEREEAKGTEFDLDLSSVPEGEVTASVVVKYGASKNSLEDYAYHDGLLSTISFIDESEVAAQSARYDTEKKVMRISVKNNGAETAYVRSTVSLLIGGAQTDVTGATVREIAPGSLFVEEFPVELSADDLSANKEATVSLDYGARRGFLVKHGEYTLPLGEEGGFPLLLVGGIVLLLLVVLAFFMGRKGKK